MLAALRDRFALGLLAIANRLSVEPRYPGASRVATGARTLAGVVITPDTAVTISAVWAAIRYLTQTVAVLPWHVMRDGKNGAEISKSHPNEWLIYKRANDECSSFQFRETLLHWALRWGNGYAEIERTEFGVPYALWPIHPERVLVCRAIEAAYSDSGREIPEGALYYEVNNGTDGKVIVAAADMFHLRGFGEGPVGVNVISYASQSLGWARAIQLFGASFFGNGMNIAGVVVNKKPLSKAGLEKQKAEFQQLFKGPNNANKTAFLDNDADWKPIGADPAKSQLIEASHLLIEEVCRWFGVPPHKVMHLMRATFSNIEHQAIEVVIDSVSPWVKRFEDEADWKLFGRQNRLNFYTKMNMRALMRGDNAARSAYYKELVGIGAMSPNRVLELEDENTIGPEGDIHVMQNQNVTLKTIANPPAPVAATPSPPTVPGDGAPLQEDDHVVSIRQRVEAMMKVSCPTT